MKGTCYELVPF